MQTKAFLCNKWGRETKISSFGVMKTHALKTLLHSFSKIFLYLPSRNFKNKSRLLNLWGGQQVLLNKVVNKGSGYISTKSASGTHCEPEELSISPLCVSFLTCKMDLILAIHRSEIVGL